MSRQSKLARRARTWLLPSILCIAPIAAVAGLEMHVEGDLVVDEKIGVGITSPYYPIDVFNNASTGTQTVRFWNAGGANQRLEMQSNSGDAYVQITAGNAWSLGTDNSDSDKFEICDNVGVGSNVCLVIQTDGKVGIGTTAPEELLTIGTNEALALEGDTEWSPTLPNKYAAFFVQQGEMYVADQYENDTQLSSHADPREIDPGAVTAFSDPAVELPFSFRHSNGFIGKGAVVDMAAVVSDLEGITAKKYTYVYDLPPDVTTSYGQWQKEQQRHLEKRSLERILSESPEIETTLADALEQVEIEKPVQTVERVTKYRIDYENAQVVQEETDVVVTQMVGTGEHKTQLKPGYRFDEDTGKVYRPRTAEDVHLDPIAPPELPQWIVDRLPAE